MNKTQTIVSVLMVGLAMGAPAISAVQNGAWDAPSAQVAAPITTQAPEAVPTPTKAEPAVIVVPTVVIVGGHARKPKTPCVARDEGTRELTQGHGTVRTFTFCH
jgi:hypothetical protein